MTLLAHLETGTTTIARAWDLTRRDGQRMGFTDHDRDLQFDGLTFRASAGLSARALEQMTGLAVDNTEAAGALSDAGLTEADILAGRYDSASLVIFEVNWADPDQRRVIFRGTLGEITREGDAFRAELRGLAEGLGVAGGRIYHSACGALLGDDACRFDLGNDAYHIETVVEKIAEHRVFGFSALEGFVPGWFAGGRLSIASGRAEGLVGLIRSDRVLEDGTREIALWDSLRAEIVPGDSIRIEAGCDKQAQTCRLKFNNFMNFRGFPHIPGEDWMSAYPKAGKPNEGGQRRRPALRAPSPLPPGLDPTEPGA